jgi:predicted kinase
MPEAIIFMGAQASGKTTFYAENYLRSHVRVRKDLLRTRNREKLLFEFCIDTQMSFVVDNTNPTRTDRERYLQPLRGKGFTIIGCYFQSSISECL